MRKTCAINRQSERKQSRNWLNPMAVFKLYESCVPAWDNPETQILMTTPQKQQQQQQLINSFVFIKHKSTAGDKGAECGPKGFIWLLFFWLIVTPKKP